jgi:2-polyprenyl-3-methyl-5-hydroxy-6-metoxy-1,4-benzoquinol methylase
MNLYDDVPYPTLVQDHTHPDRMNVVASLFGMNPAPIDRCRVLEVGCGDGTNLLSQAYCCPNATFVGIDLADRAIREANETTAALHLRNIRFEVRDLTALPDDFGEFDYITAHGIYAWVPDAVREGLLRLCRKHLAPNGIAFVSYNAMPGGHMRRIARDLMRFHTREVADPAEKVRESENILEWAIKASGRADYYRDLLQSRLKTMSDGAALFHDDLNDIYEPVYFEDFVADAVRHRLQYAGEADFFEMSGALASPTALEQINQMSRGDRIRKEQYMDFLNGRAFRQTLLCREEVRLAAEAIPGRIGAFHISTSLRPAEKAGEFVTASGRKIETNHPVIQRKLRHLHEITPSTLPVSEITGGDPLIEKFLFQLYAANYVQLHSHPPFFTLTPGERPEASALARYQAVKGEFVATLAQTPGKIEGDVARKFLVKMDGTRTRRQLAEEMSKPFELVKQNVEQLARLALFVR